MVHLNWINYHSTLWRNSYLCNHLKDVMFDNHTVWQKLPLHHRVAYNAFCNKSHFIFWQSIDGYYPVQIIFHSSLEKTSTIFTHTILSRKSSDYRDCVRILLFNDSFLNNKSGTMIKWHLTNTGIYIRNEMVSFPILVLPTFGSTFCREQMLAK